MVEKVKPLKYVFEPLYWNRGSIYQNTPSGDDVYESIVDGGDGTYSGSVNGGPWTSLGNNVTGDCYIVNLVNRKEIDLTGLAVQEIALAPLGQTTQRMETYALGYTVAWNALRQAYDPIPDGRALVREFVFYTTTPISDAALSDTIFNTLSTLPPYMGDGNLTTEQLVAGYSSTYTRDNGTAPLDGQCVKIQESKLGFGDIINAPTLYCTKVVQFLGRVVNFAAGLNCSGGSAPSPLFLDIPQSTEVITVAEIEPDTVEYFTSMARSLQPPDRPA